MALQDLTPQLRTRLSQMERAVGWFVILAAALLLFGFGYYLYHTAERKGWFTPKFKYQTWLNNAAGLKTGDPVKLMGFTAGEITEIIPNEPDAYFGVTVNFLILKPHYGYIWDDSKVKVSSDFLGNRFLEITKGAAGLPTIDESTNKVPQAMLNWQVARKARAEVLEELRKTHPDLERTNRPAFNFFLSDAFQRRAQTGRDLFYTNLTGIYGLEPEETPALNDRLERLASQIELALPNILNLTNKLAATLDNATLLATNLSQLSYRLQPILSNLTVASATPGALGELLLPTNVNSKLDNALGSANYTINQVNTNLTGMFSNLDLTLMNLADITSNLSVQVRANTNMLGQISRTVVDTDNLVQGLKRHWLLRSAFKGERTNAPPVRPR